MVLLHLIKPVWPDVFFGFVPSKVCFISRVESPEADIRPLSPLERSTLESESLEVSPATAWKLTSATVMPHALFLGSSLAGIDRLDMIPKPPSPDDGIKRSFKMPSLGLVRRLKGQSAPREEETIEMERTTTRPLADLPALEDTSAREADADSKPDIMPAVTRKDTEMEAAMKKYEAELKAFDRIRWTDLHISHATVNSP